MKTTNSILIRRNDLPSINPDLVMFAGKIKTLANGFVRIYKQNWRVSSDIMKRYGRKMLSDNYKLLTIKSESESTNTTSDKCQVGEDIAVFFAPYIPICRGIPTRRSQKHRSSLRPVRLSCVKEREDLYWYYWERSVPSVSLPRTGKYIGNRS